MINGHFENGKYIEPHVEPQPHIPEWRKHNLTIRYTDMGRPVVSLDGTDLKLVAFKVSHRMREFPRIVLQLSASYTPSIEMIEEESRLYLKFNGMTFKQVEEHPSNDIF